MKHLRIAACLFAVSSLAFTGCSETEPSPDAQGTSTRAPEAAEVNVQQPKETSSEMQKPSSGEASTEIDYGNELGTLQISVKNSDGYTATIDTTVFDRQMRTSSDEMPAWCVSRYDTYNEEITLTNASSIVFQAVTAKVQLDPHEGFPEPTEWAPTVIGSGTMEPQNGNFEGYGRCTAYSSSGPNPSSLTDEGYEMASIDLSVGRATPSEPLPTTLEQAQFYDDSIELDAGDPMDTCTIEPTEEFIFVLNEEDEATLNSPDVNNGSCSFKITPRKGS